MCSDSYTHMFFAIEDAECNILVGKREHTTWCALYYSIEKQDDDRYQKDKDATACALAARIPALYLILYKPVAQIKFSS